MTTRRAGARRAFSVAMAVAVVAVGCGDDGDTAEPTTTTTSTSTTTTTSTTSTTAPIATEQVAIWPAAGTVFDTPEAVAEDFVSKVLEVPPLLGEFRQGDARSGEIDVLSGGEGTTVHPIRSTLLVRQLGPSDGWFVLAAANEHATVTAPEAGSAVAAGPLRVTGAARGFEGAVVVRAFVAGAATPELDRQLTQGGSMEDAAPYSVTLDLAGASAGDTVVILVRGGTGVETDPGDFGAVAVVVGP